VAREQRFHKYVDLCNGSYCDGYEHIHTQTDTSRKGRGVLKKEAEEKRESRRAVKSCQSEVKQWWLCGVVWMLG
jgi:hypothetical protein